MASQDEAGSCTNCKKPQSDFPKPLKRCAKCHNSYYCSRECQKADWKAHKPLCGSSTREQPGPGLGQPGPGFGSNLPPGSHSFSTVDRTSGRVSNATSSNPFSGDALQLETLPEKEVFNRIIDSYRMRVEDEYKFRGDTSGIYNDDDPLKDFQKFLGKAEERGGCLPSWWSEEKSRACQQQGVQGDGWSDLNCVVEKSDIQEHYGNPMTPLMLRVLAEKITGSNVMSPGS